MKSVSAIQLPSTSRTWATGITQAGCPAPQVSAREGDGFRPRARKDPSSRMVIRRHVSGGFGVEPTKRPSSEKRLHPSSYRIQNPVGPRNAPRGLPKGAVPLRSPNSRTGSNGLSGSQTVTRWDCRIMILVPLASTFTFARRANAVALPGSPPTTTSGIVVHTCCAIELPARAGAGVQHSPTRHYRAVLNETPCAIIVTSAPCERAVDRPRSERQKRLVGCPIRACP